MGMKAGADNDYSVCTTWVREKRDHYLINVVRGRWDFPGLKRLVAELARQHRTNRILIEDKVTKTALIQQMREEKLVGGSNPIACLTPCR